MRKHDTLTAVLVTLLPFPILLGNWIVVFNIWLGLWEV